MRNNFIPCIENPIFCIILLSILPHQPITTVELGSTWPPTGIQPYNTLQVPLLNTAILLASGITVPWAHLRLLENDATQAPQGLFFTVLLGIYFTALQAYEYIEAPFTPADSAYGWWRYNEKRLASYYETCSVELIKFTVNKKNARIFKTPYVVCLNWKF
jgi:hypothetical protein